MNKFFKRLFCALQGHGGINVRGSFCKRCGAKVKLKPKGWK